FCHPGPGRPYRHRSVVGGAAAGYRRACAGSRRAWLAWTTPSLTTVPEAVLAPSARPFPDDDRFPSGWFTWEECDLLADWARDKLILELGVYLGRSTVAMARTARHVVSVDHFQGSPLENWYKPED